LCIGGTVEGSVQYAMSKSPRYTAAHAGAGLDFKFPEIETWQNHFHGYEIVIDDPELPRSVENGAARLWKNRKPVHAGSSLPGN